MSFYHADVFCVQVLQTPQDKPGIFSAPPLRPWQRTAHAHAQHPAESRAASASYSGLRGGKRKERVEAVQGPLGVF